MPNIPTCTDSHAITKFCFSQAEPFFLYENDDLVITEDGSFLLVFETVGASPTAETFRFFTESSDTLLTEDGNFIVNEVTV